MIMKHVQGQTITPYCPCARHSWRPITLFLSFSHFNEDSCLYIIYVYRLLGVGRALTLPNFNRFDALRAISVSEFVHLYSTVNIHIIDPLYIHDG